jgi:flavodoxin
MNVLVAVFSDTGNTLKVAEAIRSGLEAEMTRILTYTEPTYSEKGQEAYFRLRVPIKPCVTDLKDYSLLVLCCPDWRRSPPPAINEYIAQLQQAEGRKFAVAVTTGGSSGRRMIGLVRKDLEARGMVFVGSMVLRDTRVEAGDYEAPSLKFAREISEMV